MTGRRTLMSGVLVAAMLACASPAVRAQAPATAEAPAGQPAAGGEAAGADSADDPRAAARAKLVEGGELLKQGLYADALQRFKDAYALVPSPKIFYNFGLAYMGLDRATEAVEAFDKFLDEATDASPDLRANAERQKSTLLPRIASVGVMSDVDGAEISVDGRSYGVTPRKTAISLDPGPHQLVVEKAGMPPFAQKLNTEAGKRVNIKVTLSSATKPVEPVTVTPVEPGPPPEPPHDWKWTAGLAVAAGAAALLGFGIYEQLQASSKYQSFNDYAPPAAESPYGSCDASGQVLNHGGGDCTSLLEAGDSAKTKALVGFIVGGALAAGSVALLVLSKREPVEAPSGGASSTATSAWSCTPVVDPARAGLACGVRF